MAALGRTLWTLAVAASLCVPSAVIADVGIRPGAIAPIPAGELSDEARIVLAEFQLKDVHPSGGVVDFGIVPVVQRPLIDARMFTIILVNRTRHQPYRPASTTRESIDAWTNTVVLGSPGGYGTSVDQWVAMAYMLGPI